MTQTDPPALSRARSGRGRTRCRLTAPSTRFGHFVCMCICMYTRRYAPHIVCMRAIMFVFATLVCARVRMPWFVMPINTRQHTLSFMHTPSHTLPLSLTHTLPQHTQGGPECVSVSFNGQGQCVKLTVGVLMDPELGSTGGTWCRSCLVMCLCVALVLCGGVWTCVYRPDRTINHSSPLPLHQTGLGGVFGVLYGVGVPLPPFVTRPLPQHLRHWKVRLSLCFSLCVCLLLLNVPCNAQSVHYLLLLIVHWDVPRSPRSPADPVPPPPPTHSRTHGRT